MKETLKWVYFVDDVSNITAYSVKKSYKKLVGNQIQLHWPKFIWHRLTVPKHRFFLYGWYFYRNILRKNNLVNIGVCTDDKCNSPDFKQLLIWC